MWYCKKTFQVNYVNFKTKVKIINKELTTVDQEQIISTIFKNHEFVTHSLEWSLIRLIIEQVLLVPNFI